MFEHEIGTSEPSVLLCVLQLFATPLECLFFGLLVGGVFTEVVRLATKSRMAELLVGYLVFSLVGFCIGYGTQTAIPRCYQSGGRWIWIGPFAVLAWGLVEQSRATGTVIGTYFTFSRGDEGLGVALITWPTLATCLYSVGVSIANRPAGTPFGKRIRGVITRSPLARLARVF